MQPPATRYVEHDGATIAYQVVGEGPFDLVFVPGFVSHLDLQWTDPGFSRFLRRLASFSRLILFDKTGTGISDPTAHIPTLEERRDEILAVMDAAGSEHASFLAFSEGGPATLLLAATTPERVRSLVLYGTFATTRPDDEAGAAWLAQAHAAMNDIIDHWGEGRGMAVWAPSLDSELRRRFYAVFERSCASPRTARALIEHVLRIDVRSVLGSVQAPTLVVHRTGDRVARVDAGRALAAAIPGARFAEMPGEDHAFWFGDFDPILDEMEEFLTGARRGAEPDRVLATVLFTDIAGSTERAAELGDAAWRGVLERHDALVRESVAAHGGRIVKHIGDGMLATFDGPARAVRCAEALTAGVRALGVELRAGVHTGECEVIGDDVGGMAVHIGARVSAQAGPGEVLVSQTVKDLVVGSGLAFAARGEHELKGVPGTWRLYALGEEAEPRPEPLDGAAAHMRTRDRVVVSLARRAPRTMRLGARLAGG
ncbi:MAG TPA: adenylate/guanylate cyclase domain-containing protein [Solirubrobacteraceae bacterium]|nr:adenylate/guanylate cyclase domain-containing protein [Solirubrobacteraceae bacterium]